MWGEWGGFGSGVSFVKLNPHRPVEIWAGGQGAIENGFLVMSTDGGNEWVEWFDLVENPTVAKEIVFDPVDPKIGYVGFEGALMGTLDRGETWQELIKSSENRFFFGIAVSTLAPSTIYAAGWLKRFDDPQPLNIFISQDGGTHWREESNDEEDFGGVMDMKIVNSAGQERLFLGLARGGVYEVNVSNGGQ